MKHQNFIIPCRSIPMPYYVGQVDYSTMPLTFKSHGNTKLNLHSRGSGAGNNNFYISRNGGAWQFYCSKNGSSYTNVNTSYLNAPIIQLTDGQTVAFSGTLNNFSYNTQNDSSEWQFNNYTSQSSNSKINWDSSNYLQVYGNAMSLHNWETLATNQCYRSMFRDSTMISSCWNVVFPSGDNLNRPNGAAALFRSSRVAICPKMIICTASNQPQNFFDYTWNGASQLMYVGAITPGQNGSWYDNGGGVPIKSTGVFCKSPSTPRPNVGCTVINWHQNDDTYWVVNSSNQETSQQVILNDGGTITYV